MARPPCLRNTPLWLSFLPSPGPRNAGAVVGLRGPALIWASSALLQPWGPVGRRTNFLCLSFLNLPSQPSSCVEIGILVQIAVAFFIGLFFNYKQPPHTHTFEARSSETCLPLPSKPTRPPLTGKLFRQGARGRYQWSHPLGVMVKDGNILEWLVYLWQSCKSCYGFTNILGGLRFNCLSPSNKDLFIFSFAFETSHWSGFCKRQT